MRKIFFLLILSGSLFANAQIIKSKLDVVGGIGAREFIHAGLRYQYTDITQIGFNFGGDLEIAPEVVKTYGIDHFVHFGQLSLNSNRPVWYARQGLLFSDEMIDDQKTIDRIFLVIGAGREFSVNTWLGFCVDAGINWQLRKVTHENQAVLKDNLRYIIPMARFQLFISF